MRYRVVISYDGSKFYGFQRQKNERSVQKEIEDTLSNYLNEEILIKGSSRTDALVHAYYQVFHFDSKDINTFKLKKYLNNNLKDIKVKSIKRVSDTFHARHSVKDKTYLYKIRINGNKNDLYHLGINYNPDINKMREASIYMLGTHNFKNFVAGKREDYNTEIYKIKIFKLGSNIYMLFKGKAFYRYMVRNLVGALLMIGKGKINKEAILDMLNNPEKEKRLPTSSPQGLYLYKINYK